MSAPALRRVRVQQFCWRCEEPISGLCQRCAKDKDRRPRVVEVYDAPKIHKWCACRLSAWIECQVDPAIRPATCQKFMWKRINKDGTLDHKNHFCNIKCTTAQISANRTRKQEVDCSCGCGRKVIRKAFSLKAWKYSYFSIKCRIGHKRALILKEKKERDDGSVQSFWCEGCKEVRDHFRISNKGWRYRCLCGAERSAYVKEKKA